MKRSATQIAMLAVCCSAQLQAEDNAHVQLTEAQPGVYRKGRLVCTMESLAGS